MASTMQEEVLGSDLSRITFSEVTSPWWPSRPIQGILPSLSGLGTGYWFLEGCLHELFPPVFEGALSKVTLHYQKTEVILFVVHLPFGRSLRYLVIRPLEESIPSHEDQSIGAKTICNPAPWGVDSRQPHDSLKPSFGT